MLLRVLHELTAIHDGPRDADIIGIQVRVLPVFERGFKKFLFVLFVLVPLVLGTVHPGLVGGFKY